MLYVVIGLSPRLQRPAFGCAAHLGHGIRSHRTETLLDSPRQRSYPAADKDDLLVLSLA